MFHCLSDVFVLFPATSLVCSPPFEHANTLGDTIMATSKTILCVDDHQDVRDAVRMVLESVGYTVEEAASGKEGLEKFEAVNPDFVLVDMMMESIDAGINLAQAIRQKCSDVPVYMLSSATEQLRDQVDPAQLGLNGTFQKPLKPAHLVSCVQRILG